MIKITIKIKTRIMIKEDYWLYYYLLMRSKSGTGKAGKPDVHDTTKNLTTH